MMSGSSYGARFSEGAKNDATRPKVTDTHQAQLPQFRSEVTAMAAFGLYAALLLLLTWKHTFWRDESEVWLVARSSSTIRELLRNIRYEGHPPLWYLVQYGLTRYTANVEWMKLPNFIFSIVTVAFVLTAKHLRVWVRLGIVFSYYMLFEYGTIARNYMIGIMFLVAVARFVGKRGKSNIYVPILLSLAALTSLPALVVSMFLGLFYLWWIWQESPGNTIGNYLSAVGISGMSGCLIYFACALGAAAIIRPPADSGLLLDSQFSSPGLIHKITQCGQLAVKAYFPIPQWQPRFWNTILLDLLTSHIEALVGLVLIVLLVLFFKNKPVQVFFVAASGIELAQMVVSGRAFQRHVGWLFIIFMLALLLDSPAMHLSLRTKDVSHLVVSDRWRTKLLAVILGAQVAASLVAVYFSLQLPFSESRNVTVFLKQQHLDQAQLAFEPDYTSQSVLAYLPHSTGYDLERHAPITFLIWNRREFLQRRFVPTLEDLKSVTRNGEAPVLITEKKLGAGDALRLHVALLAAFEDAICPQDSYYVYR